MTGGIILKFLVNSSSKVKCQYRYTRKSATQGRAPGGKAKMRRCKNNPNSLLNVDTERKTS